MRKPSSDSEITGVIPNVVVLGERVEPRIVSVRGLHVILDVDLAELYEVPTKVLNQAVRRNIERFPEDFMFQLTSAEAEQLTKSQGASALRSQFVTSKGGRGGRRYLPLAFTEQGVAMLSSVLRSSRAVQVNIAVVRTFVKLRQMLAVNRELSQRLEELESRYDKQFKVVFDAIRRLMTTPEKPRRRIGF